jgi:hypothetical protein
MQMIGLPPDYVVNRNSYIEAVTMDDIRRVAAELMDPEALHVVVVGQPEGLESTASRRPRPPARRGAAPVEGGTPRPRRRPRSSPPAARPWPRPGARVVSRA